MRYLGWVFAAVLSGACVVGHAQVAPPGILKEDCSTLKGKAKRQCEARNTAGETPAAATKPVDPGDMPTGADADVPGEPPTPRRATAAKGAVKPDTSDMPSGKDADPPADSMVPLLPNGQPDPRGSLPSGSPKPPSSSSSSSSADASSSSSSSTDDDDVAPTTAGGDTPVKAATLKDLGSHADSSAARVKLEQSRVNDDLKVGWFYLRDGNLNGAEARFKDALQHDPDDPEAHFAMAELLLKQKRKDEAAAQLKRYLELAPDDDHTKDAKKLLAKLGK